MALIMAIPVNFGAWADDSAATAYSPGNFGANYSLGGRIRDWFTGENKTAEQMADSVNKYNEMAYNREEAQKSRDWSEYMASTSLQRMMADAKKAGINPVYLVGNSGSSPASGATASASGGGTNFYQGFNKRGGALKNFALTAVSIAKLAAILAA